MMMGSAEEPKQMTREEELEIWLKEKARKKEQARKSKGSTRSTPSSGVGRSRSSNIRTLSHHHHISFRGEPTRNNHKPSGRKPFSGPQLRDRSNHIQSSVIRRNKPTWTKNQASRTTRDLGTPASSSSLDCSIKEVCIPHSTPILSPLSFLEMFPPESPLPGPPESSATSTKTSSANKSLQAQDSPGLQSVPSPFPWEQETPDEDRSRARRKDRTDAAFVLLPTPPPIEEDSNTPRKKKNNILEQSPQSAFSRVRSTTVVATPEVEEQGAPKGVLFSEQIKMQDKTILAPIDEEGQHADCSDKGELSQQVRQLTAENAELKDKLARLRKASQARLTPFQEIFDEVSKNMWQLTESSIGS